MIRSLPKSAISIRWLSSWDGYRLFPCANSCFGDRSRSVALWGVRKMCPFLLGRLNAPSSLKAIDQDEPGANVRRKISDFLLQDSLWKPESWRRLETPTSQYRNVSLGADGTVSLRRVDTIFDPVIYEIASWFWNWDSTPSLKGGSTSCLSAARGLTSFPAMEKHCTIPSRSASSN